jgi:acyl dehydratase
MLLTTRHVVRQGRAIGALAATAARSLWHAGRRGAVAVPPPLPGPELSARVSPPPPALVRDYLRHVGGDPSAYAGAHPRLPAHLFSQWSLPLAARAVRGVPYRLHQALNSGCRMEMRAPLPAGEPLTVRAQLLDVNDDGHRAVLHERVVTGVASAPSALVADLYLVVPTGSASGARARPKPTATVPADARELARWRIGRDAGLEFAFLTGDFNPVHWLRSYARAAGLPGPILQGFATLARAMEALHRVRFAGAIDTLATVDVRFVRPVPLGITTALYLGPDGRTFTVGDLPGSRAYLTGHFTPRTGDA